MSRTIFLIALATVLLCPWPHALAVVVIDLSPVGDPGNGWDVRDGDGFTDGDQFYGSVSYAYRIGTYEVKASQYVEFLNAKDPTGADLLDLYNAPGMGNATFGAVQFSAGNPNGNKYSVSPGRGNWPISGATWYSAIRFANWLSNGQGSANTETGSYTLLGGTPIPSNATTISRSSGANWVLPNENEWYKAAFYDYFADSYFSYATYSDDPPTADVPNFDSNSGNFAHAVGTPVDVGSYELTTSPYGLYDLAGNVVEWTESLYRTTPLQRATRGGHFFDNYERFDRRGGTVPDDQNYYIGFRVAQVPEPSTLVLAGLGLVAVSAYRLRRRKPRSIPRNLH